MTTRKEIFEELIGISEKDFLNVDDIQEARELSMRLYSLNEDEENKFIEAVLRLYDKSVKSSVPVVIYSKALYNPLCECCRLVAGQVACDEETSVAVRDDTVKRIDDVLRAMSHIIDDLRENNLSQKGSASPNLLKAYEDSSKYFSSFLLKDYFIGRAKARVEKMCVP